MTKCLNWVTALATAGVVVFLLALPAEGEGRETEQPRDTRGLHGPRPRHGGPDGPLGEGQRSRTRPQWRRMGEAEEAELLALLRKKRPEHYERLVELRESNPRRYRMMLQGMWHWYQRIRRLPEEVQDAAITEMDSRVEAWRLAREHREATSAEQRERVMSRLREVVAAQFDAEQKVRAYRLAQLEEQLKRARAELKGRAEKRDQIIEDLVKHVLSRRHRFSKTEGGPRPMRPPGAKVRPEHDRPVEDEP